MYWRHLMSWMETGIQHIHLTIQLHFSIRDLLLGKLD